MLICNVCGGNQVEHDPSSGSSFCTVCGAVLEENTIVSELTFGETDGGQAILRGQFVADKGGIGGGATGGFALSSGGYGAVGHGHRRLNATESREITLANARRRIQQLAAAVNLSDQYVDMAHRWFILALQHSFTRGRRGTSLSAACLYIVCRQEKTSHMLLDFSEVLRINVYLLGNIFLKLVRLLNLDLPLVDPSLYMGRFAAKLEFGDKTQQVANTALRISSRMKRDWIQTGRKPSGICGACLLVSARLYGFQRSQSEIIQIVKVCESTIRKRLIEFSELPSSQLTPQEFHTIWLEHEMDPPVFIKNKQRELEKELENAEKMKKPSKKKFSTKQSVLTPALSGGIADESPVVSNENKLQKVDALIEDESNLINVEKEMTEILQSEDLACIEQETIKSGFLNVPDGDIHLSDLDEDDEILHSLLSDEEKDLKSKIWYALNRDFLEEQEKRQVLKESLVETENTKPKSTKKRSTSKMTKIDVTGDENANVLENALKAASTVIDTKKVSKKINYSALDDLFDAKKALLSIS